MVLVRPDIIIPVVGGRCKHYDSRERLTLAVT